jgi:hypothetical protein
MSESDAIDDASAEAVKRIKRKRRFQRQGWMVHRGSKPITEAEIQREMGKDSHAV